jgi:O-antigen/teichoic acid export membrane protein
MAALVVNTGTSAGQLVAAWVMYRVRFYKPIEGKRTSHQAVYSLLKQAYPLAMAAILAALHTRISVILLEQFTDAGQVGYYAAAGRFIEAGRLIPHAFFDAVFPLLASMAMNRVALNHFFRRVAFGLAGFGLLFALGGWLLAPLAISLTYGEAFAPAVVVLQIGVLSLLPMLLKGGRILYWFAQGQEQFVNRMTAIALVLRVALSLWLIPVYGAAGVMIVNLLVEGASGVLLIRNWKGMVALH